jgi:hypothetical protein
VDFVGDDCEQGLQEGRCRMSVSLLVELSESKLRCAVNRDKQVKFAFFGAHFSDIDVEVADRVPLERLLAPCLAFDRRKPADLVALAFSRLFMPLVRCGHPPRLPSGRVLSERGNESEP